MKRLVFALVIAALLGSEALAADFDASIMYRSTDPGWKLYVTCSRFFVDGQDGELPLAVDSYPVNLAFYKQAGIDGWDGPTGFFVTDSRTPISGGTTRSEEFYLWARVGASVQPLRLYQDMHPYLPSGVSYKLVLVSVPAGVDYTGPTQWGIDHGTITLPYYANYDGLTGYHFRMEFTAVPEPSSIAALGGGVMGLLALRKRRR